MTSHDVLIAGAGPAGSHLALRLARAGFTVGLLDRARFPRVKPCGEFLSPDCLPLLDELGLRQPTLERGAQRLRGMRLFGFGHQARGSFTDVGGTKAPFDHGYTLRREVLDELAVRAAERTPGVTLYEGLEVRDLLRDATGRVLGVQGAARERRPIELRAAFTVGADGLRSRVARALGVQRAVPWLDKMAFAFRFAGAPREDWAEVHFVPHGYLAGAPVDDGLYTLNLVIDRAALPGGRSCLDALLQRSLALAPALARKLAGARVLGAPLACGPLAGRTTAQTFAGAALVGDACGYVDPVTGEGLWFAMRGAALLATALEAALRQGRTDARALDGYLRARRQELAPRARLALLLQRGLRRPRIAARVLALLEARPRLCDLLVSITGDYAPMRELRRPSVWWRALRRPGAA